MTISIAAAIVLAEQCAPTVAPETLLSIVQVESSFDPLAIGVNGLPRVQATATNRKDAVAKASALIAGGRNIDLGLAQINSKNLGWLGLSIEDAFDPCRSLAAGALVLQAGYARSNAGRVGPQAALQTAFSFYNTGRPDRGFANGYVGKVTRAAAYIVPAIGAQATVPPTKSLEPNPFALDPPSATPAWDVFGRAREGASNFVINLSTQPTGSVR
jgi:type IV secretion system protein VirB1